MARIHIRLPKPEEPQLYIALSVGGLWKGWNEEGSGLWFEVLQPAMYPPNWCFQCFGHLTFPHPRSQVFYFPSSQFLLDGSKLLVLQFHILQ
jgi:hypothetical protein